MNSWNDFEIVMNEEKEQRTVFYDSLAKLSRELGIREPMFKGRLVPTLVPGSSDRWFIHPTVRG
jgi:hypothetical protein